MARKKPAADGVQAVPTKNARRLVTIEADHYAWKDGLDRADPIPPNAIVRLCPPLEASDAQIEELKSRILLDACRVVVLPKPKSEAVPQAAKEAPARAVGARQAVIDLVEESASKDKAALRAFCEKIMAEAGL
jgi:hypothetical protein